MVGVLGHSLSPFEWMAVRSVDVAVCDAPYLAVIHAVLKLGRRVAQGARKDFWRERLPSNGRRSRDSIHVAESDWTLSSDQLNHEENWLSAIRVECSVPEIFLTQRHEATKVFQSGC